MSRKPSAETEVRRLRSVLACTNRVLAITEAGRDAYHARVTKAEQECAEWKRRFDALLARTPEIKP